MVDVAHSIVRGGYPGTRVWEADPAFCQSPSPGADGTMGTADDVPGDLRLSRHSPAIDAGLEEYVVPDTADMDADGDTAEALPCDLAGLPRLVMPFPDLGAYEMPVLGHTLGLPVIMCGP